MFSLSIPTVGVDDTVCLNHTRASLHCHLFIYTDKYLEVGLGAAPLAGVLGVSTKLLSPSAISLDFLGFGCILSLRGRQAL